MVTVKTVAQAGLAPWCVCLHEGHGKSGDSLFHDPWGSCLWFLFSLSMVASLWLHTSHTFVTQHFLAAREARDSAKCPRTAAGLATFTLTLKTVASKARKWTDFIPSNLVGSQGTRSQKNGVTCGLS